MLLLYVTGLEQSVLFAADHQFVGHSHGAPHSIGGGSLAGECVLLRSVSRVPPQKSGSRGQDGYSALLR